MLSIKSQITEHRSQTTTQSTITRITLRLRFSSTVVLDTTTKNHVHTHRSHTSQQTNHIPQRTINSLKSIQRLGYAYPNHRKPVPRLWNSNPQRKLLRNEENQRQTRLDVNPIIRPEQKSDPLPFLQTTARKHDNQQVLNLSELLN